MNRRLSFLNLFGVLLLAALCVVQWWHDRQLNLQFNLAEQQIHQAETSLLEQTNRVQGLEADLASFKLSLATEQQQHIAADAKVKNLNQTNEWLAAECEQLQTALANWTNAVALRDQRLNEANDQIKSMSEDLNASIRKYNELASNYNKVVRNFNALQTNAPAKP